MKYDGIVFDLSGTLGAEGGDFATEGIPEGLASLARHYPLFIASNCDVGTIEAFVRKHGIADLFADTICSGETGQSKDFNLEKLILRNNLKKPVMVGDTDTDARAAEYNKIPFLFVRYGYGNTSHFEKDFTSFEDLTTFLLEG